VCAVGTNGTMRKLQPLKVLSHAVASVRNFAAVGVRFSLPWAAILLAIGVYQALTAPPPDPAANPQAPSAPEFVSAVIGFIAFASIAVNWHRFILRDEVGQSAIRLDRPVWRYAGNSLLAVLLSVFPVAVLAVVLAFLPAAASVLLVPAAIAAGTFFTALSLKLPAVALGRTDFGFRDALNATHENFWPLMALFVINGAILLLVIFTLMLVISAVFAVNATLGMLIGTLLAAILNVFLTLYSISVVSSLYGFFVEKRDF
jgi:hypothetical protein